MKTLYIIAAIILLASCKKEETKTTPSCPIKVYMRVESVSTNGESSYSPVTITTIK